MSYTPGPKELAVKALREQRLARASAAELRAKVEEVKNRPPKPKKSTKGKKGENS